MTVHGLIMLGVYCGFLKQFARLVLRRLTRSQQFLVVHDIVS